MSIKHIDAALDSRLPCNLKLVAIVFADCANSETGESWPSAQYVANRATMSRRQAIRNINELIKLGILVEVGKRRSPGGYTKVRMIVKKALEEFGSDTHDTGDTLSLVTPEAPGSDTHDTQVVSPVSPEPSNNRHKEPLSIDELFDAFWSAYPTKVGKKPARKAFEVALKKAPKSDLWKKEKFTDVSCFVASIVRGIFRRINLDRQWKDGFIPNPTTYLNQERWEDEIQQSDNNGKLVDSDQARKDDEARRANSVYLKNLEILDLMRARIGQREGNFMMPRKWDWQECTNYMIKHGMDVPALAH